MILTEASHDIIKQLKEMLRKISREDYTVTIDILSSATLGQHVRHVIECFNCFLEGYNTGLINYDKRQRDKTIEENNFIAIEFLNKIADQLNHLDFKKKLNLEVNFNLEEEGLFTNFATTAGRELTYNIEHAIHHMALIKVGIKQICPNVSLPENFGIAYSTIKYQNKVCVQ